MDAMKCPMCGTEDNVLFSESLLNFPITRQQEIYGRITKKPYGWCKRCGIFPVNEMREIQEVPQRFKSILQAAMNQQKKEK